MIVFGFGMFVLAGLVFKAAASGVFNLPRRDFIRVPTVLASVVLWFFCMAIFPWNTFF